MTRKCHNHRPHTNLWHHKEQPKNLDNHKTARAQFKKKSQISLPHPDYCKTRKDAKYFITKQEHKIPTKWQTEQFGQTTTDPPPKGDNSWSIAPGGIWIQIRPNLRHRKPFWVNKLCLQQNQQSSHGNKNSVKNCLKQKSKNWYLNIE